MGRRRSWVRIPPSGRMIGGSSVVERFHVRKMSLVYTSLTQWQSIRLISEESLVQIQQLVLISCLVGKGVYQKNRFVRN